MNEPSRRPGPLSNLLLTQFLTVVNDNIFKQVVLLIAVSTAVRFQAYAALLFSVPFLLFAVLAGDCADRWSKSKVVYATKWAEVIIMLCASWALASGDPLALGVTLFAMGTQSAFLGPAKYGLLPELVSEARLARANAKMQATVVAGIVIGTGAAGYLKTGLSEKLYLLGFLLAIIAGIGAFFAHRIGPTRPADPSRTLHWNPIQRFRIGMNRAGQIPGLRPAMLAHSVYWMGGSLLLLSWNELPQILDTSLGNWSAALGSLSLFLAAGALIAGRSLQTGIRPQQVRIGAFGMAIGFGAIAFLPLSPWLIWGSAAIASLFSGMYLVPLRTRVQALAPVDSRGATLGTSQMLDFLGISLASLLRPLLEQIAPGPLTAFLALGLIFLAAGLWFPSRLTRSSTTP